MSTRYPLSRCGASRTRSRPERTADSSSFGPSSRLDLATHSSARSSISSSTLRSCSTHAADSPGEELPANDVERHPSRPPRFGPGTAADGALGAMNRLRGSLDVHPGAGKDEPNAAAPGNRVRADSLSQLRDQRVQCGIHQRRRLRRPDRVDERAPRDHTVSIERQIREREAPLAPRKVGIHPPPVDPGDELPAELNSRSLIRQGFTKVTATSRQANRVIVRLSTRRRLDVPLDQLRMRPRREGRDRGRDRGEGRATRRPKIIPSSSGSSLATTSSRCPRRSTTSVRSRRALDGIRCLTR